jgi:ribosomal protein L7/L12
MQARKSPNVPVSQRLRQIALSAGALWVMPSAMQSPEPSRGLTPEQEAEILALARPETLIRAIKRYRDFTNASLAEAKAAVEAMMAAPPKMGPTVAAQSSAGRPVALSPEFEAELVEIMRQSGKVPAIKRYRDAVPGPGLAEAKREMEALAQRHGVVFKSGPCFVATAVFEDEAAPEVTILRRWRDHHLALSRSGRAFIKTYGVLGPIAAMLPRRSPALRSLLRRLLRRGAAWIARNRNLE